MFHNIMKYPHVKLKWVKTYPRLYAHLNMQCVNIHPQPHEAGALRAQAFLTQLEALGFELTRRRRGGSTDRWTPSRKYTVTLKGY